MKPAFITALGERRISPSVVNTHESANENTITSASANIDAVDAAVRVEAEDDAEHDDHRPGDEVADAVAQQRADQRRRLPDRQRAEAIDDALRDVGVERDAGVDRREHAPT